MTSSNSDVSKYNIHIENASGLVIGDQATVTQHFVTSPQAVPVNVSSPDHARLPALVDQISRYFNLEEMRDLCFRLGIEYDDLPGEGKSAQVRELVMRVQRNGRLSELLPLLQQLRPHVQWA